MLSTGLLFKGFPKAKEKTFDKILSCQGAFKNEELTRTNAAAEQNYAKIAFKVTSSPQL